MILFFWHLTDSGKSPQDDAAAGNGSGAGGRCRTVPFSKQFTAAERLQHSRALAGRGE